MPDEKIEMVGALRLLLGGINGYANVRGKQGRQRDRYQGYTPNKTRRTKPCDTAREAAIALAELLQPKPLTVGSGNTARVLNFASPAQTFGATNCRAIDRADFGELLHRESSAPAIDEPVCIAVGLPLTPAQLALFHACGMCFAQAVEDVGNAM